MSGPINSSHQSSDNLKHQPAGLLRSQQADTQKVALQGTVKLPAIPSKEESAKKQVVTKEQVLEIIKAGRLEIGQIFGLKGDALVKCANNTSLPVVAFLRVKPFEDKAKLILSNASECTSAIKRLEEKLGRSVMWTDLLILAHHPKLNAMHPVRDHAKTQALFKHIKGTSFSEMTDSLLSVVLTKSRQNCDMRKVLKVIENVARKAQ
jgi:hypothetical protein